MLCPAQNVPGIGCIDIDDVAYDFGFSSPTIYGGFPRVLFGRAEDSDRPAPFGDRDRFPAALHLIEKSKAPGLEFRCAHYPLHLYTITD